MKFVPVQEILRQCIREPWCVGGFDAMSLAMTQGIVDAALAERSPIIIMMLPGHVQQNAWQGLIGMIAAEAERADVPVALQLDHCKNLDEVRGGIELGVSGAMIDGSALPFDDNVTLTRQAVELCHRAGVGVEAELGHVGYNSATMSDADMQAGLTHVDEAVRFVEETGVDALAVAIGTIHGLYKGRPHIDFERLAALRAAVDVPLVCHGGSDTPDEDIRHAIEIGLDKINIWTDFRLAYLRTLQGHLAGSPVEQVSFERMTRDARESVCVVARQKMRLFGSNGKA